MTKTELWYIFHALLFSRDVSPLVDFGDMCKRNANDVTDDAIMVPNVGFVACGWQQTGGN